ncbi:LOW QUALITY PROTEIN: galectin-4-like [Manacus candei]|uniref:LOW QUALITY PROTEIN: galectin-4-like n=1 Tax=Manacus candei TaxID=415023 RepID=UPI0022275666|nr:LOW QUALITY PROTEIN: galectin-4-like [Manacus candei]
MAFVPAPGYLPAYNPPLPYVAPVAGGLHPGMAIYVQGVVAHHAKSFCVNLTSGPEEGSDVALHVNPRFSGGVLVLNSRRGKHWGDEQRQDPQPLHPGGPFELVINVTPHGYRLLVNGSHYAEFPHRLPPESVGAVTVSGDLELHSASVLGGGGPCAPQCVPDMPQAIPSYPNFNLPVMGQPPTFHPSVPFVATIPGGLVPKKTIVVKGFIPPDSNRFHINLRAGPGGDILLHLNPRPADGVLVRNSHLGGSWGQEERDVPHNPFQRGRYFDLSIRCGNHRFKVFVEGQPLFDYNHRVPAGPHVDTLEIDGDVVLSYVHF